MPTPILIDGFEHKVISANMFNLDDTGGVWAVVEGTANLTFPAGRNGVAMQVAPAAAACRGIKRFATPTVLVVSFYFKTSSTVGADSTLAAVQTSGFNNVPSIQLRADGKIRAQVGATVQDTAASYNDGAWHRLDIRADVSANPWLIDWQIDGAAQTGFSAANTATTLEWLNLGTGAAETYTAQFDDLVVSSTSGDYPLGAHDVLYSVPDADGTHNAGSGVMQDNAGTNFGGGLAAFPYLDEWTPNTADYVQQVATGSGNYVEVNFTDKPGGKTVWGVEGIMAGFSSNSNTNDGITRMVDSGGTTLTDIYSGDMSETVLHYRRAIIATPGVGWDNGYNGVKGRVGFSTDVDGQPRWTALMLQYAVVDAGGAATIVDPVGMMGFFGG